MEDRKTERLRTFTKKWLPSIIKRVILRFLLTLRKLHRQVVLSWDGVPSRSKNYPMTAEDSLLITKLRSQISSLQPFLDLDSIPTEAEAVWNEFRMQIRKYILEKDPRAFLTWDLIRHTMVADDYFKGTKLIFKTLQASKDWEGRLKPGLGEFKIGQPSPCTYFPKSSSTVMNHAFHIHRFESFARLRIDQFSNILEFGGGYGRMMHYIYSLGFKGNYHIHDFPEFIGLQQFYSASIKLRYPNLEYLSRDSISFSDDIKDVPRSVLKADSSLFIATWSFSEAPLSLREKWLSVLNRFSFFLFAFQKNHADIDNAKWFSEYANSRPELRWHEETITFNNASGYLFGAPPVPIS